MSEAETNQNETLKLNMATIAARHFERSPEKFQQAALYNEAGRIQTKNSRVFFAEAKAVAKRDILQNWILLGDPSMRVR